MYLLIMLYFQDKLYLFNKYSIPFCFYILLATALPTNVRSLFNSRGVMRAMAVLRSVTGGATAIPQG